MIIKVPHIPMPGETVLGYEFFLVNGGKGANQAVAAARAGGEVTFVSCIGNDNFGKTAMKSYKNEGINTDFIKITEACPSGIALINVADSGENSISVASGANNLLLPEDILKLENVIEKADYILIQLEIPLDTVRTAIEMAYLKKKPVILNPAPARQLEPKLLEMVSIITPNEHEAALICGDPKLSHSPTDLALSLRNLGVKTVIITLGEKGACYSEKKILREIAGYKVDALDTTAAGDTFNGYLAVSLAKGDSPEKSIDLANKAASISVTRMGAQSSIPYLKEVIN
jgi:ribokinase